MAVSRILVFSGSLRSESLNRKLAAVAASHARSLGAHVTLLDLKDYPLPVFDQDIETSSGYPENAAKLKQLFKDHNGLIIASPEYNSSISGALKNVIDWVSRRQGDEPMKAAFLDKVGALLSASPGALGGLRGLVHLRAILQNIGIMVLPEQYALGSADKAFDESGQLTDSRRLDVVHGVVEKLIEVINRLNS